MPPNYIKAVKVEKVSNPIMVLKKARELFGEDTDIGFSTDSKKKYMIYDPNAKVWVHFGDINYQDYTKHQDDIRRNNYLIRSGNIKGDWKDNPYSPNNLARNLLW
jgi:hypothetical protein